MCGTPLRKENAENAVADEQEEADAYGQDEAMYGAGNGGIKLEAKIHNGWQVSWRAIHPEKKHSDHWIKAMEKIAKAYAKVKLAAPQMKRSMAQMQAASAKISQQNKAKRAALKILDIPDLHSRYAGIIGIPDDR